jgi:hypothetical protein
VSEGKFARALDAADEGREQLVDVMSLLAKAGQQRAVDVQCQPGLAPSLHGEASDEAEAPAPRLEEALEFECGGEEGVHRLSCSRC